MSDMLDLPLDPARITAPIIGVADVEPGTRVVPIHVVSTAGFERLKARLEPRELAYLADRQFGAEPGQVRRVPGEDGTTKLVLLGAGERGRDEEGELRVGALGARLPEGHYRIDALPRGWDAERAALAFALGTYRFDPYLRDRKARPTLVLGKDRNVEEVSLLARAIHYGRGLIDMPAGDMGPEALEATARHLAKAYGAEVSSVVGRELLERNYPMIHAVGRAAHEAPRLVEFEWGDPSHPRLAIIGKGITFDTGGVNMKSSTGARLMKKDMGGAAHALSLAMAIMGAKLPLRLHCLIAIAENAVGAGAYRPGDILQSRAGITVEIDNTDAEGRLVMGDALAKATESDPALIMDFATLTGAARVALGPSIPPFFSNREGPVDSVVETAMAHADPVWRLPLWQPYNSLLASPIADCKNAGGSFAGAVTAGLFLERFVDGRPWMHFDVYGWNPTSRPATPKGAEIYAVRALFAWLKGGGLNSDLSK